MITLERAQKGYEECNSCGSTKDVFFIKLKQPENVGQQSFKLCCDCRLDLYVKLWDAGTLKE